MTPTIRCPNCGHALATFDLPAVAAVVASPYGSTDVPILLRVTDAARLLSVSRTSIYQLIAKGHVPVVRIGRSIRIPRTGLESLAAR